MAATSGTYEKGITMDIIIIIAFLALYYILGLGTMVALLSGVYEDAELKLEDYLMALLFPFVLFVVFVDWVARKIVR